MACREEKELALTTLVRCHISPAQHKREEAFKAAAAEPL